MFKSIKILEATNILIVSLLLNTTIINESMAEDRSIIKKEFYIIASSYYSNKYRKGDFFILEK